MDIPGAKAAAAEASGGSPLAEGGWASSPVGTLAGAVGSAELRNESSRDGGAMRRVESLEELAPEIKHNSSSFDAAGCQTPAGTSATALEDDDAGPNALSPARGMPRTVSHNATAPGVPFFQAKPLELTPGQEYEIHEGSAGPDEVQTVRTPLSPPIAPDRPLDPHPTLPVC